MRNHGAVPHTCTGPPRARILAVGAKPNKNLTRLLAAMKGLEVMLVLLAPIGRADAAMLAQSGVPFETHSDLSADEVGWLYATCDLLAMVSTEEGFGMPIVEAQQMGCPVLTSNLSSMPEIAGAGALLVDPYDVDAIRNGLLAILTDATLRDRLVIAGRRNARRFEPAAVAERLIAIYAAVCPTWPDGLKQVGAARRLAHPAIKPPRKRRRSTTGPDSFLRIFDVPLRPMRHIPSRARTDLVTSFHASSLDVHQR
nr:glycosyltransferase [Acuticoccus kalidii]